MVVALTTAVMSSRASFFIAIALMVLPDFVWAAVPTASLPLDDSDDPAAAPTTMSPAAAAPPAAAPAAAAPTTMAPTTMAPDSAVPTVPAVANGSVVPTAPAAADKPPIAMMATPSALVPTAAKTTSGYARVSLQIKEPGSTVYVFPQKEEPDDYAAESAVAQCATNCNFELPHGEYSIRVVTPDGVRSYGDLSLHSARWVSVAPARRVIRDLGFVMGIAGVVSTVLGTALLSEVICDTCTSRARNIGGAFGLGLGIPMTAIGWSLYYIHRTASVEERILAQTAKPRGLGVTIAQLPQGAAVSALFQF